MSRRHVRIAGYASLFGVTDDHRDLVLPGAFRDFLATADPRRIPMLFDHKDDQPLGIWDTMRENKKGLYVTGRLNLQVARAREIHALMKDGAANGLSPLLQIVKERRGNGVIRVLRAELSEISIVTRPAIADARCRIVRN